MRTELDAAQANRQQAVQQVVTARNSEIMELRETIRALREALEQEKPAITKNGRKSSRRHTRSNSSCSS